MIKFIIGCLNYGKRRKKVHKVSKTDGKRAIIHQLLDEYDIQTAEDIQDALKDLLGDTIKEMMEAEMDDHLGYSKSQRSESDDYRNGYKSKRVNSSYGDGIKCVIIWSKLCKYSKIEVIENIE